LKTDWIQLAQDRVI